MERNLPVRAVIEALLTLSRSYQSLPSFNEPILEAISKSSGLLGLYSGSHTSLAKLQT
jgi:hypothetical protein